MVVCQDGCAEHNDSGSGGSVVGWGGLGWDEWCGWVETNGEDRVGGWKGVEWSQERWAG